MALLIAGATPRTASAGIKDRGMQDCRAMKRFWLELFNTEVSETPHLMTAIHDRKWRDVREEFLMLAKLPESLDPKVRNRVLREQASAELFYASAAGDLKRMRQLLRQGADANAVSSTEENMTPLAWASVCDHPMALELLFAHGAHVDRVFGYTDGEGITERTTALNEAAMWGARRAVAVLLAHHANVNAKTYRCSKYNMRDDYSCEPRKSAIFNTLGLADDPVVRRMLRDAGAGKEIIGRFPPTPVELEAARERKVEKETAKPVPARH
jgi:hypothetical protein